MLAFNDHFFSLQIFFASSIHDRIQLLLEVACDELYLTTEITSDDIVNQTNYRCFRVFLTFLKSCLKKKPSVSKNERKTRDGMVCTRISLNELTSICESISDSSSSSKLPDRSSHTSIPLYKKSLTKTTTATVATVATTAAGTESKKVRKKILPTIRTEFVSPTWSKILNEELRLRASRNESRASNDRTVMLDEPTESVKKSKDPISNSVITPDISTISYSDDAVRPSYTRDTERITRYDTEIAAIFDANSDKDDDFDGDVTQGDFDNGFDITSAVSYTHLTLPTICSV